MMASGSVSRNQPSSSFFLSQRGSRRQASKLGSPFLDSHFFNVSGPSVILASSTLPPGLQYLNKRFLRNIHPANRLHALLALLLLFQKFAFAGNVPAVALGGDVLAHGADGLTGDDLA